jgi:hypothetical protein
MQRFYDKLVWMLVCILFLICVAAVPFVQADEPVLEWEVAVICDQDAAPGFRSPGVEIGDIMSFREADTLPWGRLQQEIFCFFRIRATRAQMEELTQPVEIVVGEQYVLDSDGNPVIEPVMERVKERRYGLAVSTVDPEKALEISTGVDGLSASGLCDKAPGGVYDQGD